MTSPAQLAGAPSKRSTGATRHTCPTCSRRSASAALSASTAGRSALPQTRASPSSPASQTPSSTHRLCVAAWSATGGPHALILTSRHSNDHSCHPTRDHELVPCDRPQRRGVWHVQLVFPRAHGAACEGFTADSSASVDPLRTCRATRESPPWPGTRSTWPSTRRQRTALPGSPGLGHGVLTGRRRSRAAQVSSACSAASAARRPTRCSRTCRSRPPQAPGARCSCRAASLRS